ncbi:multidrug resistance-associated protein, putative [Entamoeba invadens IP1]|uniref:Multidrug resistance-associated protein, putative n=1 Tax=Entamoeba invadens IP1 TaxID=370355 RepID=A0A0A1U968_ENTIV|nr:multidrug resistance-associated protein, putative [Entamoeba invadens IP1]ELP91449.1 multidrug resistance-associated protein, putative [Entamoeba invadens IP1]|eukprot:XP_004258220.1 multidrug resistance-associated protein, putative [Entamoeba invadens IP1]
MNNNKEYNLYDTLSEMQVIDVDESYKATEDEPIYKEHPHFWDILFMQRAPQYIQKGRKGSLEVSDLGMLPSTLDVEKSFTQMISSWKTETTKHPTNPSLFRSLIRVEWKSFLFCYLFLLISQLGTLLIPLVIQFLIKWVQSTTFEIYVGILFLLGITIIQILTSFGAQLSVKWIFVLSLRLRNSIISMIYYKALRLNVLDIEDTGRLVNLMSNDSMLFVEQLPQVLSGSVAPVLFLVLCAILFGYVRLWAFIPIILCLLFVFANLLSSQVIGYFYNKSQRRIDKRLGFFSEILKNVKFVKYNAWENAMEKKLVALRRSELLSIFGTLCGRSSVVTLMLELSPFLAFALFLSFIITKKTLDVSEVFSLICYFNCIRYPFMNFGYFVAAVLTFKIAIKRLQKYFMMPELHPSDENSSFINTVAVDFDNVEYHFPDGQTAFSCDKLEIEKGELVCVLGSVGSGKTSFLLSLLGELDKTSGKSQTRGQVTYASQTAWLMNTTIRENICFTKQYDKQKFEKACDCACLKHDLEILQGGDLYEISERGANLSGGQRQRVSLARLFYNSGDVVLLDDPLSAVDFEVGSYIFEKGIEDYLDHKTRIIVTNQTYFIDKADRIIVINNKKMVFNGSIDELRNSDLAEAEVVKSVTKNKETCKKKSIITKPQDVSATQTEEEKREIGGVSFKTYLEYFVSGGFVLFTFVFLTSLIRCGFRLCYFIFLIQWTNTINTTLPQGEVIWFYLNSISIGAGIVATYFSMISISIFGLVSSKVLHWKMVRNLMRTSLSYFDVTPLGRLLNYFSRDLRFVDFNLPVQYEMFIGQGCEILSCFIVICVCSYYLVIVVVFSIIVFLIFHTYFVRSSIEMQRIEGISRSPIFIHFDQTLSGLTTVRNYKAQDTFIQSINKKLKNNTLAYYTLQMAISWYSQRLDWLGIFVSMCTLIVIVVLKIQNDIQTGAAGVALMNVALLGTLVSRFSQNILQVDITMQSVERLLTLKDISEEEPKSKTLRYQEIKPNWPSNGSIEFRNYGFRYRDTLPPVLQAVSARIQPKEKIGVVGRTGSGKSTLMAGIFRINEALEGSIVIDNVDVSEVPLHTLRKRVCILPQEATMFSGTIRDNMDPENTKTEDEITRVLKLVNIDKPLDYLVTENGENFSLGERQMICIARALLRGAKILIMDEATASIDIQTDILIQEMVRKNFVDCTVLTIAHRLHTIMDSNRVMVFDSGKLVEMGTPLDLYNIKESIFHNLVKKSGCENELIQLAKGEKSIAETLKSTKQEEK